MKWFLLSLSHLIIFGLGFVVGIIAYPTIIEAENSMMQSELSTHVQKDNSQPISVKHVAMNQTSS